MAEIDRQPLVPIKRPCGLVGQKGAYIFTLHISGYSKFKGALVSPNICYEVCSGAHLYALIYFIDNGLDVWIKCQNCRDPFEVYLETSVFNGYRPIHSTSTCSFVFGESKSSCRCASIRNLGKPEDPFNCGAVGDNFFHNGTLTIQCSLAIHTSDPILRIDDLLKLSEDFGKLLEYEAFTDIVLCTEMGNIRANKSILRARSPIIADLLNDQDQDFLVLNDYETSAVLAMVIYMYTGKLGSYEISWASVCDLYSLGWEYEVTGLQETCTNTFESMLVVNNVCELLEAANDYADEEMKTRCMKFIFKNFSSVTNLPVWDSFIDNNPDLSSVVLRYVTTNLLLL